MRLRELSGTERLWTVAAQVFPPFANRLVVEGDGLLDVPGWTDAMGRVAGSRPWLRARVRGALRWSHWRDVDELPRVRLVDGRGWDGLGPEGADFLDDPLDPRDGPAVELLLVEGRVPRLVLRVAHALMDGRGVLLLLRDLFAARRGEDLLPTDESRTDHELASGEPEVVPPRDAAPAVPVGGAQITWRRVRVEGPVHRLLPRLAAAVARSAGPTARVDVPVDLRGPGLRRHGNHTGLLRLAVPHADPDLVAAELASRLASGEAAGFVRGARRLRTLPMSVLRHLARVGAASGRAEGRFVTSATLSNLGRVDVGPLQDRGFRARRLFFVPPGQPDLPVFLAATGGPEGVELVASAPAAGEVLGRTLATWGAELGPLGAHREAL